MLTLREVREGEELLMEYGEGYWWRVRSGCHHDSAPHRADVELLASAESDSGIGSDVWRGS